MTGPIEQSGLRILRIHNYRGNDSQRAQSTKKREYFAKKRRLIEACSGLQRDTLLLPHAEISPVGRQQRNITDNAATFRPSRPTLSSSRLHGRERSGTPPDPLASVIALVAFSSQSRPDRSPGPVGLGFPAGSGRDNPCCSQGLNLLRCQSGQLQDIARPFTHSRRLQA